MKIGTVYGFFLAAGSVSAYITSRFIASQLVSLLLNS